MFAEQITLLKIRPMKHLLTLLFVTIASVSYSQVEVNSAATLKDHIGDSIKYCGKVVTARLMERMNNAPAFLNIDEAYPRQSLTVVVWSNDRPNFKEQPEKFYLNKNVCIYGKLEKYKEQLQIVIHSEAQLVVQE
jgi:hypothetical protein